MNNRLLLPFYFPAKVKGSMNKFRIKENERSMANPNNLKGKSMSQMMG
ncbi:hypothetical protein LZF95_22900 [Algoriphagus sp. AGSA1]|nr:hypothetical protein [Algoriphagus sp. AGSA1]MCE7057548.1 hypothetical protein [Algoriphagus sp. AGSA1]